MNVLKSHKWAAIYLVTIVVFATIYSFLPENSFKYENCFEFLDGVYFSVTTITTLGYGDISPVSSVAKLLVSLESLAGLFLLGMFLNGEAQKAVERRDKQYIVNALNHSFRMLTFMEEYFIAAFGGKSDQTLPFKTRFENIAKKLKFQPEAFVFTENILNNINWGARHTVNDFRLLALDSKALSDDAFLHVSAIITNLDGIDSSPVVDASPTDRGSTDESMQHKASVAYTNAAILSEYLNNK